MFRFPLIALLALTISPADAGVPVVDADRTHDLTLRLENDDIIEIPGLTDYAACAGATLALYEAMPVIQGICTHRASGKSQIALTAPGFFADPWASDLPTRN